MQLLGNLKRGLAFVVSAPAGTGKTTLTNMLIAEFPTVIHSISFTTREPRNGEKHGVHYNFIDDQEFKHKVDAGDFLEYAEVYGQRYGTSRNWVEEQRNQGKHVMLVIDTQGALQLMGKYDASFIFIRPPSIDELRKRLENRKSEATEKIAQRLSWAEKEIKLAEKYDYQIINDDLHDAYQVLRAIVIAEEHRIKNQK